ncbi:MAG: PilZ domain-containing protein [Polyangiaceae bacterium]
MRDKRRCSRTPVEIPVEFAPRDPKHVAFGFVTDLTLVGAAVSAEFPLQRGSDVLMRMWRPAWDEEIVLAGVVRWARGRRMGVELAPMAEAVRYRLSEQIVASRRPAPRTPDANRRHKVRPNALTQLLALAAVSACGGLSTAGLLLPGAGADGGRAPVGAQIAEDGAARNYDDDASAGFALSPLQAVDAGPADAAADVDGAYMPAAHDSEASTADGADLDAETPCVALAECCSRLIVAPPLAAACYVTAQSDGAAGGCGASLATFRDSGLCP